MKRNRWVAVRIVGVVGLLAACGSSSTKSSSTSSTASRSSSPTIVHVDPPPTLAAPGDVANARALSAAVSGAVRCDNPFEDDRTTPDAAVSSVGFCNLTRPDSYIGGADGYFIVWPSAAARDSEEDLILNGCQKVSPADISDEYRYVVVGHNWELKGIFGYSAKQIADSNGAEAYQC